MRGGTPLRLSSLDHWTLALDDDGPLGKTRIGPMKEADLARRTPSGEAYWLRLDKKGLRHDGMGRGPGIRGANGVLGQI